MPQRRHSTLWLENNAYPTIRECEFTGLPENGAGIRDSGALYLTTYYAVSVGTIERNYFASRRGIRCR